MSRLDSRDLLRYEPKYKVLICRECQYAIQKSAVQSHLLRHKIYRGERQSLLSLVTEFDLSKPEDVPLPDPTSSPVDILPVISGYRCTRPGCGHLCASSKRMRHHWSEIHALKTPAVDCVLGQPVKLQTFFRGDRIIGTGAGEELEQTQLNPKDRSESGVSPPRYQQEVIKTIGPPPGEVDLETMAYFHDFIKNTSLTLPTLGNPRSARQYWQTDFVLPSLQQRWLMYGLLGITALHSAFLTRDLTAITTHLKRSAQFRSKFRLGMISVEDQPHLIQNDLRKAISHLTYIFICSEWLHDGAMMFQVYIGLPNGSVQTRSVLAATRVVQKLPLFENSNDEEYQIESLGHAMIPTALRDRFDALPSLIAVTLDKPEGAHGITAVLSAIAALARCCEASFSSDEVSCVWWAMTKWLDRLPEDFNDLLAHDGPAALVVIGHWAASLLKRAEYYGCWLLRGSSNKILRLIAEKLPDKAPGLVADLIT